jgi:hypothetical protein
MKSLLIAGVAAMAVTLGNPAMAQTVGITIEPEQRTTIREYVKRERVPTVRVKERVRVGARLPADVELRPVPQAWGPGLTRYRYVYVDDRVVLVDPAEREVVHVLEW